MYCVFAFDFEFGWLLVMGIVFGSTLVVFACCLVELDGFAGL